MKKNGLLVLISILCFSMMIVLLVVNPGEAKDEVKTLRIANPQATGDNVTLGYEKLAEILEEKSGGKMKIDLYSNAILGNDRATTEAVQEGTLDMASCSSPNFAGFSKEIMAFDLPYITKRENQEKLYDAIDYGELGEYVRESLRKQGFELMMPSEYGYRNYATSSKPIKSIQDIKGIKLRTTDSPVEVSVVQALDAIAMPIGWGETYTAISQKAVDGEGNTWSLLYAAKHGEVLEYGIQSEHNYSMHLLVMNKRIFDGLTEQEQRWLKDSCQEALDWQRSVTFKNEEKNKEHMRDLGVDIYDPTPEEKQAFVDKTKPVYDKFVGSIVPEKAVELIKETQRDDYIMKNKSE